MGKKIFLICALALTLIGGYYGANFTINKVLSSKVENILQNENLQKEIDKVIQSDSIEKDIAQLIPKDIQKGSQITPTPPTSKEQNKNTIETKTPQEKVESNPNPDIQQIQFATKNEAIEFVRSRFTYKEVAELYKIYADATKDGLTAEEKKDLKEIAYKEAFKKFTPQEIEAVKTIILGSN